MVQVGNGIRTSSTSPWYHYSTSMGKLNNRKEVKNEDQLRARIIWKVETGADPGFILVRVTQNVCVIWFIFVKTHHFTIIKHGFFDWHVQPSRKIRGVGCASDAHAAPGCEPRNLAHGWFSGTAVCSLDMKEMKEARFERIIHYIRCDLEQQKITRRKKSTVGKWLIVITLIEGIRWNVIPISADRTRSQTDNPK